MTERLLQFIWQFQYFNKNELSTVSGEVLQIFFTGQYNTDQGPDFLNAKIKIGSAIWAGNVELHLKTSDWTRHRHESDKNYKNVVLHVVWENDGVRSNLQVLELKNRIAKILLQRYDELMNSRAFVPCEKNISVVRDITWKSWKERLLAERLLRKAKATEILLHENNYHWEETFWWLLARNFGMKVNADAFEALAKSIPLNILAKHKNQIHQLEALLFGQAGLLNEDMEEDYPKLLQREYRLLKKKYNLKPVFEPLYFLRMRPGNFPTIRLAQLSMLVHKSAHLFSKIIEAHSSEEVKKWLDVTANDYWHYHYRFGELSSFKKKKAGATMINNILINTVVPVLFVYGHYHSEKKYKERALDWLENIKAETNSIITGFNYISINSKSAYDSQALLELKREYCDRKKCLDCAVGNAILKA